MSDKYDETVRMVLENCPSALILHGKHPLQVARAATTGADLAAEFEAVFQDAVDVGVAVAHIPWDFVVEDVAGTTLVAASVQQDEQGIKLDTAQTMAALRDRNAVRQRHADYLRRQHTLSIANVVRGELQHGKKSIPICTGVGGDKATRVGFKDVPDRFEIEDEPAALAWAKANCPDAVKVKESVLVTPLFAHVKATGELPDGCKLVAGTKDVFYGV